VADPSDITAIEDMDKAAKRTVKVTKVQNEEVKRLIRLMGLPIVEAPGEAEAQCAELVKTGKAFAMGTEDMDALTFGTPILLRKLTDTKSKTVIEIEVQKVLDELELNYDQFIDLCILCGCDYADTIKGVGPKTALKLIRKYGDIENILEHNPKYTFEVDLDAVRELFKSPLVSSEVELKFVEPDKKGLIEFLVKEKGFSADRVNKIIERISKKPGNQLTLDSFVKKSKA
jgi:flap endonuclease-1